MDSRKKFQNSRLLRITVLFIFYRRFRPTFFVRIGVDTSFCLGGSGHRRVLTDPDDTLYCLWVYDFVTPLYLLTYSVSDKPWLESKPRLWRLWVE